MIDSSEIKIYALSYASVVSITIYYIVLLIIAILLFVATIFIEYTNCLPINNVPLSMIGCGSTSLLGSSIYYIRKIYILCIYNSITPREQLEKFKKWGTILYFIIRPIFSMIISVVVVMGLSSGVFAFFISDGTLSKSFVDFSMVIAFFLGVSNGTLVDRIDKVGKGFILKIFD